MKNTTLQLNSCRYRQETLYLYIELSIELADKKEYEVHFSK